MRTYLFLWLICSLPYRSFCQSKNIVFRGAVIHVGNGTVINNGLFSIKNGKIQSTKDFTVGNADSIVDCSGKHIYPGLISLYSTLGLSELDAVRATNDVYEVGALNPHVRSIIAYNTDSDVMPTVRSNGILFVQVTPQGGIVSGTSSVVKLSGWNWQEAAIKMDEGIHLNWPEYYQHTALEEKDKVEIANKRNDQIQLIEKLFEDALAYGKSEQVVNIKLLAMQGLFDGTKTLYILANQPKDIIESINFAKKAGVKKIVLVGARESKPIIDFIKLNDIPIILLRIHELPSKADDDISFPFSLPSDLFKAGITIALCDYGDMDPAHSRNLPYLAGTSAAYGLTKEEALQAITWNSAKILGLEKQIGSLEVGKDASFIISEGDVLDPKSSKVVKAYIEGKEADLNNKQKDLYKKYSEKYKIPY